MALPLIRRKPPAAPPAKPRRARAYRNRANDHTLTTEQLTTLRREGWTPSTIALAGPETINAALTAAATRVETHNAQDLRRLIQPWQARALTYYDMIGEVNFSSQFYSRTLAKVRLFPALLDDNGDPEETNDPQLLNLWDRVQDPGGGRAELQGSYGRLMFITGEGYLTATPDPDWGEVWEFLSPDELRVQPGGIYVRYRAPQIGTQEYVNAPDLALQPESGDGTAPDQIIAYRLWKKHPRYCADTATEILTETGWKTHDELRVGEKVMTLNHDTGLSEWQPVQAVNRFEVEDEKMVSIEGRSHSSLTTEDHRWPILKTHVTEAGKSLERKWTLSGQLRSTDRIIVSAECAQIPTEKTFSDDFVEAVAWFYTEGNIAKRYRSAQVSICQSRGANPENVQRIRRVLTALHGEATTERMSTGLGTLAPPKWREYEEPNRPMVYFWLNTAASEDLLAVAPGKVVSLDFIKALTRDQLEIFIETSMLADGHGNQLCQSDHARLDGFELACLLSGRSVRSSVHASGLRCITHTRKTYHHITAKNRRPALVPGRNMHPTRKAYTGTVWCPTTKNGTWLARRNGTTYFTGNSWWADSSMHAVLDILEELLLLTLAVRSQAKSRAANNGILLWPDEMSNPQLDTDGDEDPLADPFFEEWAASYVAPLADPGSAAAGMPLFARMAAEMIPEANGGPRFLKLNANDAYAETGMRSELIRRYAMGVDLPPEQLLGMADVNHWSGWLIDEQTWKAHLMPVTQQMCNDFNSAYLRPAAKDAGYADWKRVVIGYDATEVINHPDKGKDYLDLYNARAIGKSALRLAKGANDDDAPTDDELNEMIGVAVRDSSLAIYGIPSVRQSIEPEPGVIENAQGETSAPAGPATGADVEPGPPPTGEPDPRQPITASAEITAARMLGAAEAAIERCRERAGAKLVTHARNARCRDCLTQIDGIHPALVAATLGPDTLAALNAPHPDELVAGGARLFVTAAARLGVNGHAEELGELIERHAANTLTDETAPPLPQSFLDLLTRIAA